MNIIFNQPWETMGNLKQGPLAPALPFILGGLQVFQSLQQAKATDAQTQAQTRSLQAQADADAFNATIAEQNAEIVRGQTAAELEVANREKRLRQGSAIARAGGSGVGIGSALDILQDNAAQEELNLLTIKSEGLLRERNFLTQSNLLTTSSQNTAGQIPLVKSAGSASKAASVLSGVSKGIGKF